MKFRILGLLVVALVSVAATPAVAPNAPGDAKTLKAFRSDDDLKRYLHNIALVRKQAELVRRAAFEKQAQSVSGSAVASAPPPPPPPPPPQPASSSKGSSETVTVTAQRQALTSAMAMKSSAAVTAEDIGSITNNQVQGIDEGDIVKARGDLLIVLHHGRLFTVSIAGGGMTPVDVLDASAPGIDPSGDWYDEMLILGDRIVVIGYSYARGGTQINRFRVTKDGHLSFEDAYALKSNDYYSARNYASRLIGNKLILYSPSYLPWYPGDDIAVVLPGLRRWTGDAKRAFEPIGTGRDVYLSPGLLPEDVSALHTVTSCDLTAPVMACKATSILGPSGRVFYVSNNAVYVWVTSYHWAIPNSAQVAILYRLPLDGSAPQAVRTNGAPVDQFSFQESAHGLDVLIRAETDGDAMWAAERSWGQVALVHFPLSVFGDGSDAIEKRFYRALPKPSGAFYAFHNRFVGDHLLYGTGNGWGAPKGGQGDVFVVPVKGGETVTLAVPGGVDRIEAMGGDAVVVGSDGKNVVFSAISLKSGKTPVLGDRYVLAGASQAETRSHGFFFKPEGGPSGRDWSGNWGVLGLPVMRDADPAFHQLFREAASVVFVRRVDGKFSLLGDLPSHPQDARADACKASCIDWYGNSRPIFFGNRTFALMGYELVEAVLGQKDMSEKGRVNFAPH